MSSTFKIEIPKRVNPELAEERKNPSFSVQTLADKYNGGTERNKKRKEIERIVLREPWVNGFHLKKNNFSRMELYENSVERGLKMRELAARNGWGAEELQMAAGVVGERGFIFHELMVIPTVERLGTEEQQQKWLPLMKSLKVIANYGQTELGHGTNLRGLETTATYDVDTQEFVINTPFPSGIKFWPGELGKTSNLTILMAQLKVRGRDCGLHPFLLPIRDFETHKSLTGVTLGDIGPKLAVGGNDNGFLHLNNVRIPRENMLMRYSKVTPDGRFERTVSPTVNYGSMVLIRVLIAEWSATDSAIAATIAIRYSAVRRQSELEPGSKEPKILDFQTQQYKLFPWLAFAYANWFAKEDLLQFFNKVGKNEYSKGNFQNAPEMHAQSCALKAFTSDLSAVGLETCRRACGGHGFLMASGIASKSGGNLASVTVEGENTVLYLQVARYLMKSYDAASKGRDVTASVSYLKAYPSPSNMLNKEDCLDLGQLVLTFRHMAYRTVTDVAESIKKMTASGAAAYQAWNQHQVQLVIAAKMHTEMHVVSTFVKHVGRERDDGVRNILTRLCQLHALYRIHVNSGQFMKTGALTIEQVQLAEHQMFNLLAVIRPDAVPLVDAFEFDDESLGTAIGTYDGNAYERLLAAAQDSPLNQADVLPVFHKYIKPFQKKLQSQL